MANEEQVTRLRQGVESWNEWRNEYWEMRIDLSGADLSGADLRYANLSKADLNRAHLSKASLIGADLSGAYLGGADLSEADLREADLYKADLNRASLNKSSLFQVHLSEATLSHADLSEANLRFAELSNANLRQANLSRADLSEVNLRQADLREANLRYTNLSKADLSEANLRHADLSEADLRETILEWTIFAQNDLRTTKGLTTIQHLGPSQMELFSVQLPQDGSALHFLRGVGVPDEWIDDYRVRMMHPIQYHSCFLSYTKQDEMLATRLHADLQAQGVRCWFAPEDMKIGDRILYRIDEAIHLQDKSLLVLSQNALDSSWIEREVMLILEKEQRQDREVLFPVRVDESIMGSGKPWAKLLRGNRHIGDFTRWETAQEYQIAFERLLRDLKQDGEVFH